MDYTIVGNGRAGALRLPARGHTEAMQKAEGLLKRGYREIMVIDADGHRFNVEEFARIVQTIDVRSA
jgi:hypothetical protein